MNFLDYSIIVVYLIGLLVLGVYFKTQANKQDYFLGGRTMGWKPLSLSIMATQLSAISFVSAPAFVGLREGGGLIWLSYEIALPLAMLLLLSTILPVLHRSGVISVYDFLEQRFSRSSRLLISLVFQVSRSFATRIMIYAISIILQATIGLVFWQSILMIGLITVVYSLLGGMKAVVYGDAIQMVLIVLGTATCLGFGLYHLGGIEALLANVAEERLQAIDFSSFGFDGDGFGFWPMLFGGLVLYASYYGCDQSEAQRALSAKNLKELKKMMLAASFLRFPITFLYCFAGLAIGTFALTTPEFLNQIPSDRPDFMMPLFIVNYMPHGIIGLLLVAILAAAMSSLSSAINSLSAASLEDYLRCANKTLSSNEYLVGARLLGIFWGAVTLTLAFFVGDIAPTVIEAINKIGSVFYGPVLACFLLGVLSKRIKAKHVNLGLIAGVGFNVFMWLVIDSVFWFWWNVFGLSITLGIAYLFALLDKTTIPSEHAAQVTRDIQKHRGETILNRIDKISLIAWSGVIVLCCTLISCWVFIGES